MSLTSLVIHAYFEVRCPQSTLHTYVDNLEIVAPNAQAAIDGIIRLGKFVEFLGVPLDPGKTFTWALDTQGRKVFREANWKVEYSQKDLGAHKQYSGQRTNKTIVSKGRQLQDLWALLAQSQAPLAQKYKVLTTVAWPRAFHGASITHLSDEFVMEARRGAMKGLCLDQGGTNSMLQLSLSPNTLGDPGFFLVWDAVQQFRRFAELATDEVTLEVAAWTPDRQKKPGPIVLASRLSKVGWAHVYSTLFLDHEELLIDVYHAPVQEARQRLRAWHTKVGCMHAGRKGFAGLEFVDVALSKKPVPTLTTEGEGLLRVLHNGAFITHDQLCAARQVDTDLCKFCQQPDSLFHRHWECDFTASLRNALPLYGSVSLCHICQIAPPIEGGSQQRQLQVHFALSCLGW